MRFKKKKANGRWVYSKKNELSKQKVLIILIVFGIVDLVAFLLIMMLYWGRN